MTLAATSRAARQSVEENGGVELGLERIVYWLRSHPHQDFTRAELAQAISMKLQTACARVRDELDSQQPRIVELSPRRCRVNGRPSKTLRIAQPKTAAPAPQASGESANPIAASAALDECAAPPSAVVNAPPAVAAPKAARQVPPMATRGNEAARADSPSVESARSVKGHSGCCPAAAAELKHSWDELKVGDRFIDQGEIVEVTRAPRLVTWHGTKVDSEYTSMTVRVVGRAP